MTEELYDDINLHEIAEAIDPFAYFNNNIRDKILTLVGTDTIGYVEAEYHGGTGDQSGILCENGNTTGFYPASNGAINTILKSPGATTFNGYDEFDSVGFGRHRNIGDRLNEF